MPADDTAPDSPMEPEDEARARQLTPAEIHRIDQTLMSHASDQWQKVARIIGQTMLALAGEFPFPDMFYSRRIKHLVKAGALEAVGNLNRIRHSEVRIPPKA